MIGAQAAIFDSMLYIRRRKLWRIITKHPYYTLIALAALTDAVVPHHAALELTPSSLVATYDRVHRVCGRICRGPGLKKCKTKHAMPPAGR